LIAKKQALRERLWAITPANQTTKDNAIFANLTNLPAFKDAKSIYIFLSKEREPSTNEIIAHCFKMGKRVGVPVIDKKEMFFSEIFANTHFVIRELGIREPKTPIINNALPDIIIVPMVAYDNNKGRLGHGKGYYDKYLANKDILKVGISYTDFCVDTVYADRHDVPMDIIVTDGGIIV